MIAFDGLWNVLLVGLRGIVVSGKIVNVNCLDVFKYFELLLTVLSSMEFLMNPDILEDLLRWNHTVQKICKIV